ncbi:glutathione S-transferase [Scheffersomyces coipomensis]|uniref:glutathione S-transferase n=1 Tax=Scheffersomyces coipomensis TaxID=1788519 RepID=UPI00315DF87A
MSAPLKLYAAAAPNGFKITTFLELLGLKYDLQILDISKGEQKEPWFLKLNPNGRIPTLIDSTHGVTVSQSGAVLQYLADTYDPNHKLSFKYGSKEYYKQLEYLIFSVAEQGPITGQLYHFKHLAPCKDEYAIDRYFKDVNRIVGVFDEILNRNKHNGLYLVGDHLSAVDASVYGWSRFLKPNDIELEKYPLFNQWYNSVDQNEFVQKGVNRLLQK